MKSSSTYQHALNKVHEVVADGVGLGLPVGRRSVGGQVAVGPLGNGSILSKQG